MKQFSYVISDPCFKKSISIDTKKVQTIQSLMQEISKVIGLNNDQFTIINYNSTTKLYSIKDNTTFKLQIIDPSDDINIFLPDKKTVLIKKCSKMNTLFIIAALEKQGIYFSDLIIQKFLKFFLWGIEIPKDGFHLQAVPENIKISLKINSPYITIRYDQNQFNFSEIEKIENVITLFTRIYGDRYKIFVTKEKSSEALPLDYQLKKTEKYQIKRSLIINFSFSSNFDKKYKPFKSLINPSIELSNLALKIMKRYDIKQPIEFSYKEKVDLVKIDEKMTVEDVESEIQQKDGKGQIINILYIDFKKEKIDTKNSQNYTFVFNGIEKVISLENGTLLNDNLIVVKKEFKISQYKEIEFRIKKKNCVKGDQRIEIFKNEKIYIYPKEYNKNQFSREILYQTNLSEIIFKIELDEKTTIREFKKIISTQFETEITNIRILHKRTILLDIVSIEHIDLTNSILHVSIQNSAIKKHQDNKKEKDVNTKMTPKKTTISKPEIFHYKTNQNDMINEIELTTTTTVLEMKEVLSNIYDIEDLTMIKIIFSGKDLLDDIVLHDLSIDDISLFVYIRRHEDIFLKTAKALRISNDYSSDDDSDADDDSSENSENTAKKQNYNFVFKGNEKVISIENGTLLNDNLIVVKKAFKINEYKEIEFRIKKKNCVKDDQRIEIFKNEKIYIYPKEYNKNQFSREILYQTNLSEIIFKIELDEKTTIREFKKIISTQFETEITNIRILHKRTILLDIVSIEHIDLINSILHVSIQNSAIKKHQDNKKEMNKKMTNTAKKTTISKPEIFHYKTNQNDMINEIELTTTTTVLEMKEVLSNIYDIEDLTMIKIIFSGKDLLDDIVLHDLSIGDISLFVYIRRHEDIFLETAKALRISNDYSSDDDSDSDSDSEYSTQRGDFEVKMTFLSEDLINKIKLQLNHERLCGEGGTSTVYRINCINEFNEYDDKYKKVFLALKILKKDVCQITRIDDDTGKENIEIDYDKIRRFMCEYEVVLNLNHKNIIRSFGFYNGDETMPPCILLEYYKKNVSNSIKTLDDVDLISIIYEICLAMSFVHKNGIIHRDLKPKNILLDKNNHVKICNFGISTLIPTDIQISLSFSINGTKGFIAPELATKNKYTAKVDVYSFGIVSHFILTKGDFPVINIYKPSIKLSKKINKNANDLITKCLSMEPKKRPSFDEIIEFINQKKMNLIDGIDDSNSYLRSHLNLH